jgi:nucleoid DNA-binding protein
MMNKKVLIKTLSAQTGLTQRQAGELLDSLLGIIGTELRKGGEVTVSDFGRFFLHHVKAHAGHHPMTGKPIEIASKDVVKFKPFAGMRSYQHKYPVRRP